MASPSLMSTLLLMPTSPAVLCMLVLRPHLFSALPLLLLVLSSLRVSGIYYACINDGRWQGVPMHM
jgi:hypothetical protein